MNWNNCFVEIKPRLKVTSALIRFSLSPSTQTQKLLAAMMAANMNAGMMAGANGGIVNPGLMARGINLPVGAAAGAGFFGQPMYAQVQVQCKNCSQCNHKVTLSD